MVDLKEMKKLVGEITHSSSKALGKIKEGKLRKTKQFFQDISSTLTTIEKTFGSDIHPQFESVKKNIKTLLSLYDQAVSQEKNQEKHFFLMEGYCQRMMNSAQEINHFLDTKPWQDIDYYSPRQSILFLKGVGIYSWLGKEEVEEIRRKLLHRGFAEADLSGMDLSGLNLAGVSLRKANLTQASLANVHLEGADLEEAHLDHTNVSNANARLASFKGAILSKTNFSGANLEGSSFEEAHLYDPNFLGAIISPGTSFEKATIEETNFSGLHLEGVRFRGACILYSYFKDLNLEMSCFEESQIYHTDFDRANLNHSTFNGSTLVSVRFDEANLKKAMFNHTIFHEHLTAGEFVNSSFISADLEEARFSFSSFLSIVEMNGANLRKAKFNGSSLLGARFRGADVSLADFTLAKKIPWETVKEAEHYHGIKY